MAETAFGTTIVFGTSGFTGTLAYPSVEDTAERASYDSTALNNTLPVGANQYGGRTYLPAALSDPGAITLVVLHDHTKWPPINGDAETITITQPLRSGFSTAATWAGSGFVTAVSTPLGVDDLIRQTVTLKKSGVWTRTAAS